MKKITAIFLIVTLTIGLMGCGKNNQGGSQADTNTLRINLASEPDYLDPALNTVVDSGTLAVNSFVGLHTYDENGKLIPALAVTSTVSEDGTVYTFQMRESKWSNGDVLTANDFVYSWNRAADEKTGADYAYLYEVIARNEDGTLKVAAKDTFTLEVTLTNPCPYFLDLTAFPVFFPVHEASVKAADANGTNPGAWAQEAGFVCNGAYTLESWSHNESMVYVKNDNFYDAENVTMEKLEFMLSADDTAIYAAYNSGSLDFIDNIPNDEIAAVMGNAQTHIVDSLGTYYVGFNVNDPIFKGKTREQANKMRQAFSLLIDRSYIAEKIGQTGQIPADTFVPVGMADGNGGIFNTMEDNYSYYDAETTGAQQAKAAMELLKEAGYTFKENANGTYTCSPAISITYLTNEGIAHEAIAQTIQMDLAAIGVEMKIEVREWNVFLEERKSGKFTIAPESWVADYNDPMNMLEVFISNSENNDMQLGKEENNYSPEWRPFDTVLWQIRNTTDFEHRVELMHLAEDILMETYAVIPLYYYNDIYLLKENVEGVYATAYSLKYFMYASKK